MVRLADGKERTIQSMMATTFWDLSGRPIMANQFVERLFGERPQSFEDEEELRKFWSRPTRKALLQGLSEKGFAGEQLAEISRLINAQRGDLFDVLAYIAFPAPPITRAERVEARRGNIYKHYNGKLQMFLDFVLDQYASQGVSELDQEKLADLLVLKYHTVNDAAEQVGGVSAVRETFVGL